MGCATTGDITEPQNEVIVEAEQAGYQMSSQNPELPWYMNPEIVEFNVNDNLVYFTNSETGEEFPLIEYEYM